MCSLVDIKGLINQMTLEEKVALCSGKDLWNTKDIKRLNIPSITLTDGPYGVVKRLRGFSNIVSSTCFPTPSAMSSSWDVDLIYTIGKAIGEECQVEDIGIILAPVVNIQRTSLGGRNFEYYSEDPVLSGEIGAAFVRGVQSEGVGACVKHFAANNQEYKRLNINIIMDERTLREIYLASFEKVIKEGKPYMIMAAYNKLNYIYCAENKYLLTDILRDEWKFNGAVISDWYSIESIVSSLKAGLDLEMPYSFGVSAKNIIEAVQNGTLSESVVDKAVENILDMVFKVVKNKKYEATYSIIGHNNLAREAARDCIVLLKNEKDILPLKIERIKKKRIAIIGEYAKNPRFQGMGSANVTPNMVENPYDEIVKLVGESAKIYYAKGYESLNENTNSSSLLIKEAKKAAKISDVAILFIGTPQSYDAEGHDRENIDLPDNQLELIEEIAKVQKNIIGVLSNGSVVNISPWYKYAKAIVEAWLTGQASGGAIADILFGISNPSGKLPITFPRQLSDNPTYLDSVDIDNNLEYKEGIFVGYRYYDKKDMEVQFPFGYGLSYTYFQYSDLRLSNNRIKDNDILEVSLKVKNAGIYFGKEVVQLYVKDIQRNILRPEKELKAFTKISLNPKEEKEVKLFLDKRAFAYYDVVTKGWVVESGDFQILLGKSSRDICLTANVYVESSYVPVIKYTRDSLMSDLFFYPKAKSLIEPFLKDVVQSSGSDKGNEAELIKVLANFPIRKLNVMSKGKVTEEMIDNLLAEVNSRCQAPEAEKRQDGSI